jgi:hypothetical protein
MKNNDSTGELPPVAPISERRTPAGTGDAGACAGLSAEPFSPSGPAHGLLNPEGVPVNAGKVTQIRQQIADGSYRIDAAEIADRLITAARELFTRRL